MKSKIIFTTLLIEKSPQSIPLGAACVASAVKNNSLTKNLCDVELLPFNIEDFENLWEQKKTDYSDDCNHCSFDNFCANLITKKILEEKPEIVGFSVFVWNSKILQMVSQNLKKNNVFTIAGGPEITAHPQVFKVFDKTVCGEGEAKVPAVVYEKITGQKVEIDKIDYENLSSCYLDGTLDVCDYEGALWELARGCPFKCSYCYESKGEKTVRKFPMARIEKELDLFAQKKVPQVFVLDPTYNADKTRAIQLLKMIKEKTPDTFYYFEARAEFIDKELASYFAKIPCALQIGLQTADENVARLVNRPFNLKNFTKKINILNETGIVFGLDVIYGLPGDTFAGFKNSVNYAVSLYPNNLEIFCLSVLPGTTIFDDAEKLHPFLNTVVRIAKYGMGVEQDMMASMVELPINAWIEPYVHQNKTETITNLATAVQNKFISKQTASERCPDFPMPDEFDRILREQKEEQEQDLLMDIRRADNELQNNIAEEEAVVAINNGQPGQDINTGGGSGRKPGRPNRSGKEWDENRNYPGRNNWNPYNRR